MSGQLLRKRPQRLRAGLALLVFSLAVLFLFASALPPTSQANPEPQEPNAEQKGKTEFLPGEILVRYSSESIAKQQTRAASNVPSGEVLLTGKGRQIGMRLERFEGSDIVPGLRLARVPAEDTMAAVAALKRQPNVLYAEPNYLLYADVTNPNNPRFLSNELYGLTKIGAPLAWDTTQGSASVVVGVIDEGIDRVHQDLQANIWINPGDNTVDGLDNDANGFIDDVNGYNFITNSGNITADFHGTHVGGTVGAVGNNGIGVVGVNWNVRLMSLKFLGGAGGGGTSDAIRACNYAKQMRDLWVSSGGTQGANVRVLNNSYGGGSFSQAFLDAINGLNQSSILFVASAGNVAAGAPEPNNEIIPHYPSSYVAPNLIGVANTDSSDNLSGSSHFGLNTIHLGAPGAGILSTTPGNNYGLLSGTSMATPHVSGAAALLLAHNPNLTVQQLKSLLIYNGDPAAALLNKTVTGRRLNVFNSFQALAENDTTPPGTVTNFQVNSQNGRSLNLGWISSGDDGAAGQASLYRLTFTDSTTSVVIPLRTVLPSASGSLQSVDVTLPYRHTAGTITLFELDNVGNEGAPASMAVSVPPNVGDPYLVSLSSAAPLSTGGTALALIGDDKLRLNYSLPFAFPFFGQNFTTLHVSTNGNLFFSTPPTRANGDADDVPGSVVGLTKFKMISGLWDDLRTDRTAGDDVFVIADSTHIIFRWKGVTFGDGTSATEFPVNFEIELLPDGTVNTRYGSGNTHLHPVVGIAGGEPDAYFVPSHTSEETEINLTNAQQVTFTPRASLTFTIASSNPDSGVNITVSPNDVDGFGNGTTAFSRNYNAGALVDLTAPATAGGNHFLTWQRNGVDFSSNTSTTVLINATITMTAVYVPARVLTVASSNPASGVNITVSPLDRNGAGNGTTQFSREYAPGTVVTLTAPATAAGNVFQKWQVDGMDSATALFTTVTMNAAHTVTAVYVAPAVTRSLTVTSSNPQFTNIALNPSDNEGRPNANTPFTSTYNDGVLVQLTAPISSGLKPFQKWQRDGVDYTASRTATVLMDADHSMKAVFGNNVQFTVSQYNVNESDGSVTVTVERPAIDTAASVDYATGDDTATQKGDYILSAGRLNFAPGQQSKSFTILIVDDVYQEGPEKFKVTLSNPVGIDVGFRGVADVVISDNDSLAPTTNPLDNSDARFFVRQHYLDFLNREPDASGLDFWRDQITSCGSNAACIEVKRINVSAAFFRSIEFQETGYLIERLYKVAYGDATGTSTLNGTHQLAVPIVRYQEFLPDSQQIGAGLVVGEPGWQVVLENNKRNFTAAFVERTRFTTAFPAGMSPTTYVDTLNTNAGGVLSTAERNQLIFDLTSGAKTRSEVLRQVAEDPDLKIAEDSRAFVLMQYFGYLRRNPNDPPELGLDYTGYDFWLTKLNQFNGNFIEAEMVKAFITSTEYRRRFGP